MSLHTIALVVNGERQETQVSARRLLADLLRDDLHLTGTKRGCETGVCGACSVLVDGEVVKSCLSLAVHADGCAITTVEGLARGDELHPVQDAFMRCGGLQCGYCTPGFVMASCALLAKNPHPTEHEVRKGLNGNLCRCTGYSQIVESVMDAAEMMQKNVQEKVPHGN
ncbi:(2Fe-2S)-binding protein [Variovorax sp. KK3]|uniref:(2Fe-2S)-binding protein n=1 Tax=Variovorax sp. KK3 TaxID=1855728 RepID=UPI00097C30D2|nr:(2Fe-2S)-binding protein [Variovorax sp. KK3]